MKIIFPPSVFKSYDIFVVTAQTLPSFRFLWKKAKNGKTKK